MIFKLALGATWETREDARDGTVELERVRVAESVPALSG